MDESIQLFEMYQNLLQATLDHITEDKFIWWHDNEFFYVKSVYVVINSFYVDSESGMVPNIQLLAKTWKTEIPSKIQVFLLKLFLNHLPTKDQL